MPLTIDPNPTKLDVANREELALSLTGDAAYPQATGGYDFGPGLLPFRVGNRIDSVLGSSESGAYYLVHDEANAKLKVFQHADGAEVADGFDLSAEVFSARVLGR